MSEWIFEQTNDWWKELLGQPANLTTLDKDIAAESIPRSDLGAARVIAEKFKKTITFVDRLEQWHVWDGRVHRPLESAALIKKLIGEFADAERDALAFIEEYYEAQIAVVQASGAQNAQQQVKQLRDEYEKHKFGQHRYYRDRLYSTQGVTALVTALQVETTVASDFYNDDRQWLVVQNGVIDLYEFKANPDVFPTLLEHSQDRPVTRYFHADYDLSATAPSWYTFLERSLPDRDSRRLLTKVTGAAFMAAPKMKIIPNLQGPKDSGKSLFIETMHKLGDGYSAMPDATALLKVQGTNFYQDELRNKRFVGITEPDEKGQLDEGFTKRVSGGDFTQTRTLHGKPSGWYPQCVMYIASNHAVRFNTRDTALLERVALINFPNQFFDNPELPEEQRLDKTLGPRLLEEGSGILNWLLWGMKWFMEEGIEVTDSIIANRRDAQVAGSSALQWIEEFVQEEWLQVLDESEALAVPNSHFVSVNDAYLHYRNWAVEAGEKYTSSRKFFSKDIQTRYGTCVKSGGMRFPRLLWTDKWRERNVGIGQTSESGFSF